MSLYHRVKKLINVNCILADKARRGGKPACQVNPAFGDFSRNKEVGGGAVGGAPPGFI